MKRTSPIPQLIRFYRANQRYRFVTLLTSLILLFVVVALAYLIERDSYRYLAGITIAVLFDLVLLSAVNAVCQTRRTATTALSLAVPAALFSLMSATWHESIPLLAISNVLAAAFITFVIVLVLDFLFRSHHVDANMICASLCVYLLIGMVWASLYTLCEVAHRNSFVYAYAEEPAQADDGAERWGEEAERARMGFLGQKSLTPIYFSFVTLTTLGYGDMVPVSPPARILAILEAVIGQIYLTVLVARLVGLHIAYVTSKPGKDE